MNKLSNLRTRVPGIPWWSSQWLGLCAFTAEGAGSIPGWGTKIPQAMAAKNTQKNKNKTRVPSLVLNLLICSSKFLYLLIHSRVISVVNFVFIISILKMFIIITLCMYF